MEDTSSDWQAMDNRERRGFPAIKKSPSIDEL